MAEKGVPPKHYYVGVDVGSGSVRAALVDNHGSIEHQHTMDIEINNPRPDHFQQSSLEIWNAVVHCVASVVRMYENIEKEKPKVGGIGFAATCSLVVVGKGNSGLSIDMGGDKQWDVIMWMDHRAKKEALEINHLGHQVLKSVGGTMSCEMQPPKLMWIKKNLPDTWHNAQHFFDLTDFLTWKATGSDARSLCSIVCKWTFNGCEVDSGWSDSFFSQVGLDDLVDENYSRIGDSNKVLSPGHKCGYLDPKQAMKMNLTSEKSIAVAASLIDAHAGALGMLAINQAAEIRKSLSNQLGIIAGTSTCHMLLNDKQVFIPGVWGPYQSAILSKMWLHEGGQSAVGNLLDHIVETHPAYSLALREAEASGLSVQEYLYSKLKSLAETSSKELDTLTSDVHVWPDFHGNRSPLADPEIKGMISGLTMSKGVDNLALMFLATTQALCYGTRLIVEQMTKYGHDIKIATICGGLARGDLFVQTNADVLNIKIVRPKQESVLLGSAMLAARADETTKRNMKQIINDMLVDGQVFEPKGKISSSYHNRKYRVFLAMLDDQRKYEQIMNVVH